VIAAPMPFEDFSRRSCFEFRIGVEGEGAAGAARHRSRRDLEKLSNIIDRLDEVKRESGSGIQEDFAFHLAIASASKNGYFVSVLRSMKDTICNGMLLSRTVTGLGFGKKLTAINLQHQRVYQAIVAQDETSARSLMREHLLRCKASTAHWDLFSRC